jgi:mRNA interferase MazF
VEAPLARGDVVEVDIPVAGRRPAVVVTRSVAIPYLSSVTVAEVTRTIRGIPSEVRLEAREAGQPDESVVNCDNLFTVRRARVERRLGRLPPERLAELDRALRVALGLE